MQPCWNAAGILTGAWSYRFITKASELGFCQGMAGMNARK